MDLVDVYFHKGVMYNLKDMSTLGVLPKGGLDVVCEHLCVIQESYTIGVAIMGFNHVLRNAVYTVFPKAIVMIDPQDVRQMIGDYLGSSSKETCGQEEMAAGIDGDLLEYHHQVGCQRIYNYTTKKEAIYYYRQWQGEVPLGIKSFHHVIRTIDYYYEEIFNYFDFHKKIKTKTL